ncbi:MAG TPA: P-II family nitrogen regulator [Candidatus Sumerlaeota bacterium]|nr:MAG: Nitrogen regulatory protein P-II 1 [candidate division BRC1 bacterium ADurb.BinA292]HOE97395.1 P-II family nitrogen regulator [Candidatus Sumerlaeota bacterium]HOR27583.1 P-II family nitrogen regulator [Candidatus Sumerlaeota bacterium]HPK03095.1 P-II family nitrogen regulator [Candidatus Sumerlaeota bacterium]
MKMIRAIIQPHRLEAVRDALTQRGIMGMTVFEARGYGRQRGHTEVYRGAEYQVAFRPKIVADLVVPDNQVDDATDAIVSAAKSGSVGDGKIFIFEVGDAIRIRTGDRDENAL